ncbi:OmpA family protein [Psychrobacter sp. AOP22-C1-22]|uniref:OmpA family protein n=1 Tax=unclassified Psychrobacter TaxID=196806 RepID=UPI001787A33A|nr:MULTISPECIES: OmpA family protein [unclassified Psychrobacter]MBE0405588.1 OmpA family protein [Psychrobacter sp. FME6]MBE0445192.1 OmpA family protein [Psychrobacter sp. FME5]MDN5802065.1 OmpA family protein [Psychrobacter sp.]MDN5890928.1 OmpA family protein [Psychrobacter sp.]
MDIISHLTRTVSPAVLEDDRSPAKKNLLEQFYAIFAARLADNDTYDRFANENIARDDQGFYDRVWTDGSHRDQIARELAGKHNVDVTAARGLIAMAAPLAFHEIKSLAGTTPVPQFLSDNLANYQHHIPAWASAVLPAGILATTPAAGARISDTVSTAPLQHEEEPQGSFMKALLPIIGLIILGALAWALLRGCQETPEPVATPAATTQQAADDDGQTAVAADVEPASLRIATGENSELYACRMNVGDETLQTNVMDALTGVFGDETSKCRADVDDHFAIDMPAAAQLATILPIVKNVPNASMVIKGDNIIVNAPDAATLDKLVDDLQAAAPAMTVKAEGPLDEQSEIDNSLTASQAAMDDLGDNPDPRDVARALSLQVVNFEVDKAVIPDANKPLLDNAVALMEQVPNMKLMIIGHTDKTADADYNMKLSQERAESMKEYLVAQGADPSKLMTKGMGETDPIADNSTEQGRFRNRRIEFMVNDETVDANASADADVNDGMAITNDALDPDLNPLDSNNDDLLPDGDDATQGTAIDPTN